MRISDWSSDVCSSDLLLSVSAAGLILNPKTARSQCLGGMTMGIGAALMEEAVVDKRFGYFVNHDLAEYHVPVHADIPALEVIFLQLGRASCRDRGWQSV